MTGRSLGSTGSIEPLLDRAAIFGALLRFSMKIRVLPCLSWGPPDAGATATGERLTARCFGRVYSAPSAQTDRTMGGMIRHLVAEAARREAPEGGPRHAEVRGTLRSRMKWRYVDFINAMCPLAIGGATHPAATRVWSSKTKFNASRIWR